MYGLTKLLMEYHLNCELRDVASNELIKSFKAREATPKEVSGGFVGGGIASLGQNYTIATAELAKTDVQSIAHKVIVEGQSYEIASTLTARLGFSAKDKKFYEKVLRLI